MAMLSTTAPGAAVPLLFAVAFWLLSLAVGRRLLRALGASADDTGVAERGVVATVLGAGVLQFVPFALGSFGRLTPNGLRWALVAVAVALARDVAAVVAAAWRCFRSIQRPPGWLIAWGVALSPVVLLATLLAVTPTLDPDGLGYHLTVPKRWLAAGSLSYLPTYPYSNAPMGMELLFTFGLAVAGDSAAKCVHLVLGLVGVAGLYMAGKRIGGRAAAAIAAAAFLVGPAAAGPLMGWAYVEAGVAAAMIASSLAWLIWREQQNSSWLGVAGTLAGVAVSFKISALPFPVALWMLTVVTCAEGSRGSAPAPRAPLVVAAAWKMLFWIAVPTLPWFARAFLLTGNPLYPVFARWIPSRDLSPALAARFDEWNRYMTWGSSVIATWGIERRKALLAACATVIVVLAVVLVMRLRSRFARASAAVIFATLLLQLSAAGLYVRYWVPVLAAATLPALALTRRHLSRSWIPFALVGATMLGSAVQVRKQVSSIDGDLKGLLRTAVGVEDRRDFLQRHVPRYSIYDHVNRELPADVRVLLTCNCAGFYLDRTTYCSEFVQDSLRFTNWEEFATDLRRLGVTHVVAPRVLAERGPAPMLDVTNVSSIIRLRQYDLLRPLLERRSRAVAKAGDEGLYALEGEIARMPP
jgi:hypothetical protein